MPSFSLKENENEQKDSPWSWGIDQSARQANVSKALWYLALFRGKVVHVSHSLWTTNYPCALASADCPFDSWILVSPKLWLQVLLLQGRVRT